MVGRRRMECEFVTDHKSFRYNSHQSQGSYRIGDPILHIELRRWADVVLIAPCSANTLSKIAYGLCDNLAVSSCTFSVIIYISAPRLYTDLSSTCPRAHLSNIPLSRHEHTYE